MRPISIATMTPGARHCVYLRGLCRLELFHLDKRHDRTMDDVQIDWRVAPVPDRHTDTSPQISSVDNKACEQSEKFQQINQMFLIAKMCLQCFENCWLGIRKSIRPVKSQ